MTRPGLLAIVRSFAVICCSAASLLVFAGPAHAADTAPCDPGGTTAADARIATELNSRLTGTLDGQMTAYRVSCARVIAATIMRRGLPVRAAHIAITTTIVETTIRNLTYGDRDSIGLFQQRPSMGWGTVEQIMNPTYSTNKFIDKMLTIGNWQTAPIGEVCQKVQVSAFPARYYEQSSDGIIIANAVWGLAGGGGNRDFSGDGNPDVMVRDAGVLKLYEGNGAGRFKSPTGEQVGGAGWSGFSAIFSPGDFSGDGNPDVIVRDAGVLKLYEGNGAGGFKPSTGEQIGGAGWSTFTAIFSPGDFSGDGNPDVMVRDAGVVKLYEGNGSGGFKPSTGEQVGGAGWSTFTAIFSPGDFSGDGNPDVIVRDAGVLKLYEGNGAGRFKSPTGEQIGGAGWSAFTAVFSPGDFSGDGKPDVMVRDGGVVKLYEGNGSGGFKPSTGGQVGGAGWSGFTAIF